MGDRMRGCALACSFVLAIMLPPAPGFAQEARRSIDAALPSSQTGSAGDDPDFWSKITLDPVPLDTPAKPLAAPHSLLEPKDIDVARTDNPDGTASISINKSLATTWDAKIGSNLGYTDIPSPGFDPTRPLPVANGTDQQSRAVWANVAVPDFASVNTRIDSGPDQGKYGTSIARSVPLGSHLSVTVQDSYSVTEAYGTPTVTSAIPLAAIPTTGTTPALPQVWGNERQVKLNVLPTGTTFGAGWTTATGDPVTHNTFSADQKLYGSFHVTTSVTDVGEPTASKSVTAGFKMNW